jgi:hypothetical protein
MPKAGRPVGIEWEKNDPEGFLQKGWRDFHKTGTKGR